MPKRIQRKRTKGWRMPEGAIYVGRPSKWGNPFSVGYGPGAWWVDAPGGERWFETQPEARKAAAEEFALHIGPMGDHEYDDATLALLREELGGRDLACWCPLDQPCHADVLLELANDDDPTTDPDHPQE